jgi:cytochrome P450
LHEPEPDPARKLAKLLAGHEHFCRVAADPRDPYPNFAAARRDTPVRLAQTPAGPSALVFRADDVAALLRDGARFSTSIVSEAFGPSAGDRVLISLDGERHRVQRALVAGAFGPAAQRRWQADLLPRSAGEAVERLARSAEPDLVRDLALDFPAQVIAEILGLPRGDFARFQAWTEAMLDHEHHAERAAPASAELRAYLLEIARERRARPREDLISDLLRAECEGRALAPGELFAFVRMLLPAGVETTYRALGNLLWLLLAEPARWAAVRAEPGLIEAAVDEALRFEVPMLVTHRIARIDSELRGVAIPAGASVIAVLASANRDESRHADPERFDLHRPRRPNASFGAGPHVCLGMALARAELRAALTALLGRFAALELCDEDRARGIEGLIFRSPFRLRVRLE